MSLRHLKKVFDSEDALPVAIVSSEEENVLEPDLLSPAQSQKSSKNKKKGNQKVRNKFELLAAMEMGMEGEGDDEHKLNEDEGGSDSAEESNKKPNKRKQKKKKKKRPNLNTEGQAEENTGVGVQACSSSSHPQTTPEEEFTEGIELSPEEVEALECTRKVDALFEIDPKSLNPENELKRMFGSKVIRHEKSGGTRYQSNFQHRRNLLSRRGRLVYPKEQRTLNGANGISFELLSTDERTGHKAFKFSHSQAYKDVQRQFLAAVNTYNPDTIVNLMRSHPYHIDSHIQLSDMAKHSEDMQIASELVEDGINYLQNVFDHQFDVCSPTCQLPYKYQENRALHILLFKYLVFLGQRGCPHTALQLCKKLLSLDPNVDPLGVTLLIDFYGLKSKEFSWLCDLYELWNGERNLNQLPNWAYSIALAYFMRRNDSESADSGHSNKPTSSKTPKSVSTIKGEDMEAKSNELLQYALIMFPSVLVPLLEKCGIQSDSKVVNHWYFNSTISKKQTKFLNLLCDLYVWRTHHLWRDASILRWLEFNTQAVIAQIDQDSKITNEFNQKRQIRYTGSPYNILRHVILTDTKDITIPLPPELSKKPVLSFDPITPRDAVDIYNYRAEEASRPSSSSAAGGNDGLLSMLFRSLVFDLNAVQGQVAGGQMIGGNELAQAARGLEGHQARLQAAEQAQQADGGGAGENNTGLAGIQDSVHTLLSAMRDLLHVVTPARAPGEEQNSSEAED